MDTISDEAETLVIESTLSEKYAVIREIYEDQDSHEYFEIELDNALDKCFETIVIEPKKLGDETARWIATGNCLHKTSVISALSCLAVGLAWPDKLSLYMPLGCTSIICAGTYAVSWQLDPCCQYQVVRQVDKRWNTIHLPALIKLGISSSSPVVLEKKNDSYRRYLQNSLALIAAGYCTYKCYSFYFETI